MAGVRPFTPDDIAAVVSLRRRAFRHSRWKSDAELGNYFRHVFFDNPWHADDLPALVYEDSSRIVGFLGVMPRSFRLGGRPVRAAVTTQLMVDSDHRGLAAMLLMRAVMAGPQELLLADVANEPAQLIYEGLGGSTARLYSMFWSKPLRPLTHSVRALGQSLPARGMRAALRPMLASVDALLLQRQRDSATAGTPEPLTPGLMATQLPVLAGKKALHPDYDVPSVRWLLDQVKAKWSEAELVQRAVGVDGRVVGWFIYVLEGKGDAQVIQLIASINSGRMVLDHLIQDARSRGGVILSGRLEPRLLDELGAARVRFAYGGRGVLVHTKEAGLLNTVLRGEALLSGLEGEWWMNF